MLCEKCGANTATTHIRSVINGKVYEKHLCSHCAASDGYGDEKSNNLTQMLSNMFGDTVLPKSEKKVVRCSCCGKAFADIADSGKCGCAECYITFYEQLLPYFKRIHGSIKHIGKVPECNFSDKQPTDTVKGLRKLLAELIEQENYEQAAVIRDKIKSLQEDV